MDLKNKVAIVTGSAHRVGRHIALALAKEGCHLMVHFHRAVEEAEKTISELREIGVRASSVQADLSKSEGIHKLFEAVDHEFGHLDIHVNSAAILNPQHLLEVQEKDWDETINLNLKGAFFCTQAAARRMKLQGEGCIINISDVIGHKPWERFPVHSISKFGVEMLTRLAAVTLAPQIRVNAVVPGLIMKPEGMEDSRWETLAKDSPLRRSGTPSELVSAVLFLLKNDYVTGEILVIDGGISLVQ
jgi:pteridine reductase